MIWIPTLELLLQLLAILLCLKVGVHIFLTHIILVEHFVRDKPLEESDHDRIWRTKWWFTFLVLAILTQKFFWDNNIPLEMFPWINSSQKIHHVRKS